METRRKRSRDDQEGIYQPFMISICQHYSNVRNNEKEIFEIGSILCLRTCCKYFRDLITGRQLSLAKFYTKLDFEKSFLTINDALWIDPLHFSLLKSYEWSNKTLREKKQMIWDRTFRFPKIRMKFRLCIANVLMEATTPEYVLYFTNNLTPTQSFRESQSYNHCIKHEVCPFLTWLCSSELHQKIATKWFHDGKYQLITFLTKYGNKKRPFDVDESNSFDIHFNYDLNSLIVICFMIRYLIKKDPLDLYWLLDLYMQTFKNQNIDAESYYNFFYLIGKTNLDEELELDSTLRLFSGLFLLKTIHTFAPNITMIYDYNKEAKCFNILLQKNLKQILLTVSSNFTTQEILKLRSLSKSFAAIDNVKNALKLGKLSSNRSDNSSEIFDKLPPLSYCFGSKIKKEISYIREKILNFSPNEEHKNFYSKKQECEDVVFYWPWKSPPSLTLAIKRLSSFQQLSEPMVLSKIIEELEVNDLFEDYVIEYKDLYHPKALQKNKALSWLCHSQPLDIIEYIKRLKSMNKLSSLEIGRLKAQIVKGNSFPSKVKLFNLAINHTLLSIHPLESLNVQFQSCDLIHTIFKPMMFVLNLTPREAKSIENKQFLNLMTTSQWELLLQYRPVIFFALVLDQDMNWLIDVEILRACFKRMFKLNGDRDFIDFIITNLTWTWELNHKSFGLFDKIYKSNDEDYDTWWTLWILSKSDIKVYLLGLLRSDTIITQILGSSIIDLNLVDKEVALRKTFLTKEEKQRLIEIYKLNISLDSSLNTKKFLNEWFSPPALIKYCKQR